MGSHQLNQAQYINQAYTNVQVVVGTLSEATTAKPSIRKSIASKSNYRGWNHSVDLAECVKHVLSLGHSPLKLQLSYYKQISQTTTQIPK